MKNLILSIFLLSAMAASAQTHIRSGKPTYTIVNNKPVATFQTEVSVAGSYYISCWLQGVKHSDGSYSSYNLEVQGTYYSGSVTYENGDWGPTNTVWAYLSAGTHTITVTGSSLSDVPNVEFVNLCTVPMSVDCTRYNQMKSHSQSAPPTGSGYATTFSYNETGNSVTPPTTFLAQRDKEIYYTFRRLEYYTSGQTVNVSVDSIHANNSYKLISIFPYNENLVSGNTWFSTTSLSAEIANSGFYYVMVSPVSSGVYGTCWLNINGVRYFEDVPINCCMTTLTSSFSTSTYQCFAISENGDPMSFVLSPEGVLASYNDDRGYNTAVSDFDWGLNSRVLTQMGSGYIHFTTLFNSYPQTDYTAIADIYSGLRNGYTQYAGGIHTLYPNYKQEDLMASASQPDLTYETDYNCLSWAFGDWLSAPTIPYDYTISQILPYLDSYAEAYGYTRNGATEANAIIDIYTYEDTISHVSVKSKGHYYAAGYDWESKLWIRTNIDDELPNGYHLNGFSLERVFHPRYALEGQVAGYVSYHYRINPTVTSHDTFSPIDVRTIENASFTPEEQEWVEIGMALVPENVVSEYNRLQNICLKEGLGMSFLYLHSYERLPHYSALLDFCKKESSIRYLLFYLAEKGNTLAIKTLYDITDQEYGSVRKAISEENRKCQYAEDGKFIVRSARTDAVKFIKAILNGGQTGKYLAGITCSTDPKFTIRQECMTLTVSFELDKESHVTVVLNNTQTGLIDYVAKKDFTEAGMQNFHFSIPKRGIYVVSLIINGNVYEKKIVIK